MLLIILVSFCIGFGNGYLYRKISELRKRKRLRDISENQKVKTWWSQYE